MIKDTFCIGNEFEVKRIGLGTMRLTSGPGKWGMPNNKKNAIRLLNEAIEIGVNFFDTADMYGPNISEEIIAEALFPYPNNILIATKGGNIISGPNMVKANCSPQHIRNSVNGSLKRLKLDRIDLYQLHTVDPNIDIEYSIEELAKLKDQGKIRFIGVSNIDIVNLKRASQVCKIDTVQNRYNTVDITSEEIISYTQKLNMGFISYYPLSKGKLAQLKATTDEKITSSQKALIWQLKKFSNIIAIPGTTSFVHLKENFQSLNYLNS